MSIDSRGLNASACRALEAVARWLARVTGDRHQQGRFELVAGEGRVRCWHETSTHRPEDAPDG